MQKQVFTITLLEDVIVSQRAAMIGGHNSLDYLPGATLLGACAARLYARLSEQQAYTVFHSGQVRFGNALPLSDTNRFCYPMPLCWHQQKSGETAIVVNRSQVDFKQLQPKNLLNYQLEKYPERIQPQQLRSGYIALDGRVTQPAPNLRMKAAIDPKTGRAIIDQLFGYTSLPQGMRFGFILEADKEVPKTLFNQVVETLNSRLQIGRSRSAEYGNVMVANADWTEDDKTRQPEKKTQEITLWLLSDLALLDKWGQPTLLPTTQDLGLPDGQLVLEKTFIRSRRYAPFNSHYRRRELERTLLSMGSVLHFGLNKPTEIQSLIKKLQAGVGLYRQAGLGQVWVNPLLLRTHQPSLETALTVETARAPDPPKTPLAKWLLAHVVQTSQAQVIEETAEKWIKTLRLLYRSAQLLTSAPEGVLVGPSPTQWGRVLELAKTPNLTATDIRTLLFTDERAICKKHDPDWTTQIFLENHKDLQNFRQWLQQQVEATPDEELPILLSQVARRAVSLARAQEAKKTVSNG
jgi:hypothetical protein